MKAVPLPFNSSIKTQVLCWIDLMLSVQLLHPTQARFKFSHPGMDDKLQEGEGMLKPWIDWCMTIYSFSNKMKIPTKIGGDLIFLPGNIQTKGH